jgi:glycosyltransferase involved in cell wall biosynthesis
MRIVLTSNFSPWSFYSGGGQRSTHNLATALAARGHEVSVVFTRAPWERVTAPADLPYSVRWASLLNLRGRSPGLWRLSSAPTVAAQIAMLASQASQAGAPLVVHSQGEEAALLPDLRRVRRFGLVVTSRYPSFPDALLGFGAATLQEKLRLFWGDTKYFALGRALRGADFCCPPSAFGADLLARAFDLPSERLIPVHNGVPHEFLDHHYVAPKDLAEHRERPLLFFGRFAHDKGIDTLIDALARVPSANAQLVGRGPERAAMQARVEALGIESRVHFREWASHHELGELLSRAAVAVLPSRDENFSLAVLSALAVGTPLVTTPVGGTPEIVRDGENGLLVPAGDSVGLALAIERLRGDLDLALRIGQAGKQVVRSGFTWDVTAAKFEAIYERTRR